MVQFIPHYVIVDKFGFIRNISHVEKVESIINDLLNEQEEITKPQQLGQIDKECLNKINNVLNNADTQASFAILDPLKIIETEITMIQQAESDLQIPKLYYFARDYQEEKLKVILSKLFAIIPEQNWNIQKIISKTLKIPYPGLICSVCKKDIANEAQQYYSPFKSEYVCTICAEFEEKQKKGVEKYKYHDTLIFINGPLSDSNVLIIDDYKIGTNIQLNKGEEGSQLHFVKCYGCSKKPRGARYISATARPGKYKKGYIDFCHECFLLLKDKNSEKAKEIVAMNAKEGMILDSLFTRVLFYFGDQQDF